MLGLYRSLFRHSLERKPTKPVRRFGCELLEDWTTPSAPYVTGAGYYSIAPYNGVT